MIRCRHKRKTHGAFEITELSATDHVSGIWYNWFEHRPSDCYLCLCATGIRTTIIHWAASRHRMVQVIIAQIFLDLMIEVSKSPEIYIFSTFRMYLESFLYTSKETFMFFDSRSYYNEKKPDTGMVSEAKLFILHQPLRCINVMITKSF